MRDGIIYKLINGRKSILNKVKYGIVLKTVMTREQTGRGRQDRE